MVIDETSATLLTKSAIIRILTKLLGKTDTIVDVDPDFGDNLSEIFGFGSAMAIELTHGVGAPGTVHPRNPRADSNEVGKVPHGT